ncbi:GNAT family N-acetyltransferase [Solibacillus sp. CAU 1738]|uniref:GNAT family N-acetyltransferase n=1 Tax=Solibacillus sp. CAU 1738 TaxID=3140363 RepID=UPI003260F370
MTKKMEKKYIPLAEFFQNATQNEFTLTYNAIENIMGQGLPNAAYLNLSWWKKTKPPLTHYLSWFNSNYNVIDVQLGRTVTFSRLQATNEQSEGEASSKHTFIIRSIETDDARAFINLKEAIYAKCNFDYCKEYNQNLTVQSIRKQMAEWRKQKNSTILLCILNGEFAGYAYIKGHDAPHIKHVASLCIGVVAEHERIGIGTALLQQSEKWAKRNGIERLDVAIMSQDEKAISFFEKYGYEVEGTKKQAIKFNNHYYDELLFGKLLAE